MKAQNCGGVNIRKTLQMLNVIENYYGIRTEWKRI